MSRRQARSRGVGAGLIEAFAAQCAAGKAPGPAPRHQRGRAQRPLLRAEWLPRARHHALARHAGGVHGAKGLNIFTARPRESGDPEPRFRTFEIWIPAFAGMSGKYQHVARMERSGMRDNAENENPGFRGVYPWAARSADPRAHPGYACFTSPRLRGEVARRSSRSERRRAGEGASPRVRALGNAPSPRPSPRTRGEGGSAQLPR